MRKLEMADTLDSEAPTCSSQEESRESVSETDDSTGRTVSLLDRLKCPTPSVLSRARKVHCNPPPPKGKKRSTGERRVSDPDIPPSKRVSE